MTELQKAARIAFASEYSFYLKTHEFHWNIVGPKFYEVHLLFERIYTEVYGIIDDFAEKLRAMGSFVPASNSKLNMLTRVQDENIENLNSQVMIKQLLLDSDNMFKVLKVAYDIAEEEGEHGFSNFLAERMDAHRKHSWMLKSYIVPDESTK
jgi:starvation-inducible DNA-binding protein